MLEVAQWKRDSFYSRRFLSLTRVGNVCLDLGMFLCVCVTNALPTSASKGNLSSLETKQKKQQQQK